VLSLTGRLKKCGATTNAGSADDYGKPNRTWNFHRPTSDHELDPTTNDDVKRVIFIGAFSRFFWIPPRYIPAFSTPAFPMTLPSPDPSQKSLDGVRQTASLACGHYAQLKNCGQTHGHARALPPSWFAYAPLPRAELSESVWPVPACNLVTRRWIGTLCVFGNATDFSPPQLRTKFGERAFSLARWSRCMELNERTHPCWTWHWCFRKLLKTPFGKSPDKAPPPEIWCLFSTTSSTE